MKLLESQQQLKSELVCSTNFFDFLNFFVHFEMINMYA